MAVFNRIVAATRNPKKLEELKRLLEGLGLGVLSLEEFSKVREVSETGETFQENARLKAVSYSDQTGLPCVADDSGLEVEALGGAPGVKSARYAGPGADGKALCMKLLGEMESINEERRTARFRCAIAFAHGGKVMLTTEGEAAGRIAFEMRGTHGFGYDPVFIPGGFEKTFAEMEPEEKDSLSHRARALRAFREKLKGIISLQGENIS